MPNGCVVPGCTSGLKRKKDPKDKHIHFFGAPRDESLRQKWQRAIPRANWTLTIYHKICELHFDESFIVKCDKFVINGEKVELPRTNWKLESGAIPSIFPNLPKYLTKKIKKRKPPKERIFKLPEKKKRTEAVERQQEVPVYHAPLCNSVPQTAPNFTFQELTSHVVNLDELSQLFPSTKWNVHYVEEGNSLLFVKMTESKGIPQCSVVLRIDKLLTVSVHSCGNHVPRYRYRLNTLDDVQSFLFKMDTTTVCAGPKSALSVGELNNGKENKPSVQSDTNEHSPKCVWLLEESEGNVCDPCKKLAANMLRQVKVRRGRKRKKKT